MTDNSPIPDGPPIQHQVNVLSTENHKLRADLKNAIDAFYKADRRAIDLERSVEEEFNRANALQLELEMERERWRLTNSADVCAYSGSFCGDTSCTNDALRRNQVTPAMAAEMEIGKEQRDTLRSEIAKLQAENAALCLARIPLCTPSERSILDAIAALETYEFDYVARLRPPLDPSEERWRRVAEAVLALRQEKP